MTVKRGSVCMLRGGRAMYLALQQGCCKHADQQQDKNDVRFTTRNRQHDQPRGERCVAQGISPESVGHADHEIAVCPRGGSEHYYLPIATFMLEK
jgi:hypothetical protein